MEDITKDPLFTTGLLMFIVWTFIWKGLALWHSAKKGDKWWFIALLLINTVGLLEIFYLFVVLKLKSRDLFK